MPSGLRRLLIALLLAAAVWQPVGAAAEHGCEQARLNYDHAVQQMDARKALILLDDVIARCPSFNAWFGKGNAHRMLEQWDEALASYQQARGMAGEPQLSFMAQAYGALMQHRLGRTCEAGRTFQYLGAGSDAPLPPRVREPYEAFEGSLAEAPMDAETMACALQVTSNHRRIGVCPRLNVRIPFAYGRADLDMAYRTEAENLAEALHRVHDGSYRYRLVGHTDSRGSAAYNQNLSERRAQSMQDFILEHRQELQGSLAAGGEGESRLLTPEDTEQAHALNRRVEVRVLCQ